MKYIITACPRGTSKGINQNYTCNNELDIYRIANQYAKDNHIIKGSTDYELRLTKEEVDKHFFTATYFMNNPVKERNDILNHFVVIPC